MIASIFPLGCFINTFPLHMGHYINDYPNMLVHVMKLKKEKEGFATTKFSLKVKNACLSKLALEEEKKRVRVEDWEKKLKCKLLEMKKWMDIVALERVKAYKALEECAQAERVYASDFYLFGKDDVRVKVALKYPLLRLDFWDIPFNEDEAPAITPSSSSSQGPMANA